MIFINVERPHFPQNTNIPTNQPKRKKKKKKEEEKTTTSPKNPQTKQIKKDLAYLTHYGLRLF